MLQSLQGTQVHSTLLEIVPHSSNSLFFFLTQFSLFVCARVCMTKITKSNANNNFYFEPIRILQNKKHRDEEEKHQSTYRIPICAIKLMNITCLDFTVHLTVLIS